jgi:NADH:ubiquinone reductase (H+-translocating)
MPQQKPVVIIVGGGFGGLAAAQALKKAPVEVVLIERNNHHTFQPLLYQVATSVLGPGQIASPIRSILKNSTNTTVLLGEVTGVNADAHYIVADSADRTGVRLSYDYLILATGVEQNYFGHPEYEKYAPGLKGLADAEALRNNILRTFEIAEAEEDPALHKNLLTFVLVGAGPTGVEMASAIAVLCRITLRKEFRRIDPASARIVLVDRGTRPLATFAPELSAAARRRLEKLGVEVRLGQGVDSVDEHGVIVNGERIWSKTVIWTAGVAASPAAKWLKTDADHAGRVRIHPDLSIPNHPEIFVVGDTASLDHDGKPLPGVAQVAIQQGRYAANLIRHKLSGKPLPAPFRYFDKGNLAVVGRNFAVLESHKIRLSGYFAWLIWAFVHLQFLGQPGLRLSVFVQWTWSYLTGQRGSPLIVNHRATAPSAVEEPAAKY